MSYLLPWSHLGLLIEKVEFLTLIGSMAINILSFTGMGFNVLPLSYISYGSSLR